MKHPKGVLSVGFKNSAAADCETCMQAVHLESELDLSEDPKSPTTVQAFVRTASNGRKELVLK